MLMTRGGITDGRHSEVPAWREKFKYDVTRLARFLSVCNTDINNRRADDVVVVPAFLSQKSKNNDKVARDIMDGSVQRAEMAAAMAGTSPVGNVEPEDHRPERPQRHPVRHAATSSIRSPSTWPRCNRRHAGRLRPVPPTRWRAPRSARRSHSGDDAYAGLRERNRLQRLMPPVGQAPLPLQITNNPNYRSPV